MVYSNIDANKINLTKQKKIDHKKQLQCTPFMRCFVVDPSNMGGLSMLLMAGQQHMGTRQGENQFKVPESREPAAGTTLAEKVTGLNKEPETETKITANQRAVEDAINRTICETAVHYNEMYSGQGQNAPTMVIDKTEGSAQQLKQIQNFSTQNDENPNRMLPCKIGGETRLSSDTHQLVSTQMVKIQPDKDSVAGPTPSTDTASFMTAANANLLELAKVK